MVNKIKKCLEGCFQSLRLVTKRGNDYASGFVVVNGMISDFTINRIFVKVLIIIDNYVPFAVTLNNQFISFPYIFSRILLVY